MSDRRFLSSEECAALAKRAAGFAVGGGRLDLSIESTWRSATQWARNRTNVAADVRNNSVVMARDIDGASGTCVFNEITDVALEASCRRAERLLLNGDARFGTSAVLRFKEEYAHPNIWSDATYALGAEQQTEAIKPLVQLCERAGMLSAGYIEASAQGRAFIDTEGRSLYYPFTRAVYSVTVRDPEGTGSGWAGMSHYDWTKIDGPAITQRALDKCLQSRNPVRLEPGRYTTILEPQAVCDFVNILWGVGSDGRTNAEAGGPFFKGHAHVRPGPFGFVGVSRLGERVIDERITVTADPMDPELEFPPFLYNMNRTQPEYRLDVYHPAEWIKKGVLNQLSYDLEYGVRQLGRNAGLPSSGSFRMSGGTTSIDEMIQTTRRGVLVTRLVDVRIVDQPSLLLAGYTRDGVWLVENGKIAKPVKNFRFVESPLFALNKVEQLGVPQRVYTDDARAVICPPMKVSDFNFAQLSDAV